MSPEVLDFVELSGFYENKIEIKPSRYLNIIEFKWNSKQIIELKYNTTWWNRTNIKIETLRNRTNIKLTEEQVTYYVLCNVPWSIRFLGVMWLSRKWNFRVYLSIPVTIDIRPGKRTDILRATLLILLSSSNGDHWYVRNFQNASVYIWWWHQLKCFRV